MIMWYLIFKCLHIVFAFTWFAALFYIVRLFIYTAEASRIQNQQEKEILINQYNIMKYRLWYGIGWPSAVINLIFGSSLFLLVQDLPRWLVYKLIIVTFIFIYHLSCQVIYHDQIRSFFKYSPFFLRIWNEIATVLLFAVVSVAVLKNYLIFQHIVIGVFVLLLILLGGIFYFELKRRLKE